MRPRNCESCLHLLLIIMKTLSGIAYGAAAASHSNREYDMPANLCAERYEIDTKSIRSKTKELFRALEKGAITHVIVKVFQNEVYFVREARMMDKLAEEIVKLAPRLKSASSHFIRLLDKCLYNEKPALVFEFLDKILEDQITIDEESQSLEVNAPADDGLAASSPKRPRLNPHIPAPAQNFKQYAYQILQAVDTLHEMGIFHLDLKPANIGLTKDDTIKLFDFGESGTSLRGLIVGTTGYMAPEMSIGAGRTVESRGEIRKMDVWSVGCTIYTIYTGKLLFGGILEFIRCATSPKSSSDATTELVGDVISTVSPIRSEARRNDDVMPQPTGAAKPPQSTFRPRPSELSNPPANADDVMSTVSPIRRPQCSPFAGYFYMKWSCGSVNVKKYEAREARAKRECPQIFSEKCADKLKAKIKAFRYPSGDECAVEDKDTQINDKMKQLKSNQSQKAARLDPSNTEPQDLIDLLGGLLMFNFDDRITTEKALTRYAIFKEFHH